MTRVHICSQVNGEAGGFERWSCDGENVEGSSMSMFFDVDGAFGFGGLGLGAGGICEARALDPIVYFSLQDPNFSFPSDVCW